MDAYLSAMRSVFRRYAAWPLPSLLDLGQFGKFRHGVFESRGSLQACGLTLKIATSVPLPKLVAQSETLHEIGGSLTADLSAQNIADAVVAGSIRLEGSYGVKVIASNVTEAYIENIGHVVHEMPVLKKLAGFGLINYVVTRVQRAETAQVIVVQRRGGGAGASAQLSTVAGLQAASAGAGHDVVLMKGLKGPLLFDVTRVLIIGATAHAVGAPQLTAVVGEELRGSAEALEETSA